MENGKVADKFHREILELRLSHDKSLVYLMTRNFMNVTVVSDSSPSFNHSYFSVVDAGYDACGRNQQFLLILVIYMASATVIGFV
jgi:hypothetical protein